MMEKQGHRIRRHRQVVLVPFPFVGHIIPMLQLGTILHSKGFSVKVVHHPQFNPPPASANPDLTFLPLLPSDSIESESSSSSSSTPKISDHFLDFISEVNLTCKTPLQEALIGITAEQAGQDQQLPCPCVIHDVSMHCAEAVATHLKLPSFILYTVNPTNLLAYSAYPRLIQEGHFPLQDSKFVDAVPGVDPLRFKDLPVTDFETLVGLLPLITTVRNIGSTTSAIIFNSNECLEQSSIAQIQQEYYPVPIFSIGPLHRVAPATAASSSGLLMKEDASCIDWLHKQTENSVLYVSFGSIALVNEKELAEMAWGLATIKQPFLWVLRPGSVHGHGSDPIDLLPEGFKETVEERGCIVNWAPQKDVLAHVAVGGFWTHCGWNSILESISEGVPMICRPAFGDQRVNARYVSNVWNVGFEFEKNDLERGEIERVIRRLMVESEGEEMRQTALELKLKVELCIREGSAYSSLNDLSKFIMSV